jgi:trehalose 6-phosphate synthase/phosphatase
MPIAGEPAAGGRLLIVTNRLPVTARVQGARVTLVDAAEGLATSLRPWHERSGGLWIGWPGDLSRFSEAERAAVDAELRARGMATIHLSRDHVELGYAGFSNRVIWPLFHYLIDRVPVEAAGWEAYCEVNAAFAETVVREYRPGDRIWIHDYQLMLVPKLIRDRLPSAAIGFFLHVPFPSSEIFRTLPWRRDLLDGLLGADLVGFHTFSYMRHFMTSLVHVAGIEADLDRVRVGERDVALGVFPMGVDAAQFAALAADPEVQAQARLIREDAGDRQIVLGIDRLDFTKGIPRRLIAVERLLERKPELCDRIRYLQVAVPSRGEVDTYQRFKRQIEENVGRINGEYGTLRSTPVHYIHRSVSTRELVALYCAADVMLVTPLRDGMNLVAKEFAACRNDENGVLLLSEFAGAAAELDGAVVVNPYDIEEVSRQLEHALAMPLPERTARMRLLRRRVLGHDVHVWADEFLGHLESARPAGRGSVAAAPRPALATALAAAQQQGPLRLLLDYDGTLVPLAREPELAAPDSHVTWLLNALAATPGLGVEIVSGRSKESLETWFGALQIPLWAEHGFWYRDPATMAWQPAAVIDPQWYARVLPILERFTAATPGSRLELKAASMAWHFRAAQRGFGARQAHELRMWLGDALSNQPLEVLEGHRVVEIRLRGVSKAVVARNHHRPGEHCLTVAIGDDRSDEDLFRALPKGSLTVAVGQALNGAQYVIPSYRTVRRLLSGLLPEPAGPRPSPPGEDPAEAPVIPGHLEVP